MHPEITIVLPARDEAGSIADLLCGIDRALGALPHEIVVVDDASADDTASTVMTLLAELWQLRLIRHSAHCGQSAAIRSGVLGSRPIDFRARTGRLRQERRLRRRFPGSGRIGLRHAASPSAART